MNQYEEAQAEADFWTVLRRGMFVEQMTPKVKSDYFPLLTVIVLALAMLVISSCNAFAEITEEQAVHCILGEARGEGYEAMLAHAEAIRNRGYLKGVYGCKDRWGLSQEKYAKELAFVKKTGIQDKAKKAWAESKHTNTVKGADHWGSTIVDGRWIEEMKRKGFVRTVVVRNTAFYRKG